MNFIQTASEELPCENEDIFDARKKDFGLPHPKYQANQMLAIIIALGCLITIVGAFTFIAVLYLQKQQRISYARVAAFKIHFQRGRSSTPTNNLHSSQNSLGNTIYRDNPTTIPLE